MPASRTTGSARDQHLDTEVLKTDAVGERAEETADVQRARRPVTGQDPKLSVDSSTSRSSRALRWAAAKCEGVVELDKGIPPVRCIGNWR